MNSDDFFDQSSDRPEVVAGRYRLPHPETGVEQSWTRATTHAELPEDSFALTRWQLRQLLLGLRRRPDLLRMVEAWADDPGKDVLDEVIKSAHEVAGNDAKANLGTAIHGILQQVDRWWHDHTRGPVLPEGATPTPEWAARYVEGYVLELRRQGLRPISTMTERRVVNLALGCAGTLDNLYEEADGSLVLGDKKTGRADHYTERAFAIQLAVYQSAAYMLDQDGGPPIDLRSLGLREDYAVLIHVDPESGACATYRVDLKRGRYGANLATEVREWRRARHLLLPYVPPTRATEGGQPASAISAHRHLAAVPALNHGAGVTSDSADQAQVPESGAAPATPPLPSEQSPGEKVLGSLDELMKLSKPELQGVLRELDPGASVAHQRKILAEKIITLRSGGKVATSTPSVGKPAGGQPPRAGSDPAELPAGPIGNGEDPSDPRSPAFHRARLAEIAAAPSVGELGAIHARVVRLGGDQAWTDELTEAGRARVAVLDAASREPEIEWNGHPMSPIQAINQATSSKEMAEVWRRVTLGGSDESRWTEQLNALAHERLTAIDAAAQQVPPSTPFDGT